MAMFVGGRSGLVDENPEMGSFDSDQRKLRKSVETPTRGRLRNHWRHVSTWRLKMQTQRNLTY